MMGRFGGRADDQLEAEVAGAGAHHVEGLGEDAFVHEEALALDLGDAPGHGHGFGRRGGFVEQGGIGQFQPGEIDHHLLEVEQSLQAALGDLGLVGRVGGVPAGFSITLRRMTLGVMVS
jgi:hypothetical protein